ncbi:MAG: sulfatase-like hydrolase/transferase [Planctomycetota bacterium]|nr:sulfatase-like hydrolase/transferase [Planctomycetota bacterium]MDA0935252.1 sulfatase-like hydrolase/transferase [Planctomycetota bacterium]
MRCCIALLLLCSVAFAQDRPNVLWISSEDNGPDLGCYGSEVADTPNLDALAEAGVRYDRAWSNAPVCSAARTTIILGVHPQSIGAEHQRSRLPLPAPIVPFPRLLREAGYYCTNRQKTDYNLEDPGQVWDQSNGKAHWRGRDGEQPFFAVFNFTVSHESQVRKRPHTPVHDADSIPIPPQHPDAPEVRRDWAQYHDKITEMDAQAGRVLAQLEEDGLAENTIVLYWGDHGAGLPGFKRNAKNQGLHVPLLVRVPEKWRGHARSGEPGSADDRLVSFVDLAPTVLSLAGIAPPAWMHGRAFLGPHRADAPAFNFGHRGRMDERDDLVRTLTDGRFVYTRNFMPWLPLGQHVDYMFQTPTTRVWFERFGRGELDDVQAAFWEPRPAEELYDLESDPHETKNLASDPAHAARLEAMRDALRTRLLSIGDRSFIPEALLADRLDAPYRDVWVDAAWRASSGDAAEEGWLVTAADSVDPVVRTWALRGLAHLGSVARHRDAFEAGLEAAEPTVRIAAAEALIATGGDVAGTAPARAVLVTLADRKTAGFFPALDAWNAIDRLGPKMAADADQLAAIPGEVEDVPGHAKSYLPRLREHAMAELGK